MSNHHKKHHVKTHKWARGVLHTVEHIFENLQDAMFFVKNQQDEHNNTIYETETTQVLKVYDIDGGLVHSTDHTPATYA